MGTMFANAPRVPTVAAAAQILRIYFDGDCRCCGHPATTNIRPVTAIGSPMVADLYVCTPHAEQPVARARAKGIEVSGLASHGPNSAGGTGKDGWANLSSNCFVLQNTRSKRSRPCIRSNVAFVRRRSLAWQIPLSRIPGQHTGLRLRPSPRSLRPRNAV